MFCWCYSDFGDVKIPFRRTFRRGPVEENFLPGVPIRIRIIEREFRRRSYRHKLNPNL